MWNVLGQAATVAQLVGADVGGLITMIIRAAITAQQNKKECEQLARRVFTIRRPLAGLDDALREAHELVMACQDKSAVYRLVLVGRQAERFRDVQSRIDSYLLLFPVISHIDITRRLDRIYNILLPNGTATGPRPSMSASSMPQIAAHDSQDAPKMDWKEPHEVQVFTFKELAEATNNFAPDKMIGLGGGRATVQNKAMEEFKAELNILPSVSHKHIVHLFGYCVQQWKSQLLPKFWKKNEKKRDLLVIYEFIENRSLDIQLHNRTSSSPVTASWKMRIEIHRDVKSSNILLDESWAPRLTDFGLALTWEGPDHEDNVVGTLGYVAPEYLSTGFLNPKVDVYGFGVVMLEVLTGKRAYFSLSEEKKREACEEEENRGAQEERQEREDEDQKKVEWNDYFAPGSLVSFAVPLIEAGKLWMLLDRRPAAEPTPRQLEAAELVAHAAVRCVRLQWEARLSISEVVATLEKALELARCDG
ncbi:unnamed protein product [Urochloa decumbens]|uniref:Protein kinase domain-containing protein n=1 Tax=Urochloa decumbens TaxID=240449 RepID=A0ABC9AKK1_9POAL